MMAGPSSPIQKCCRGSLERSEEVRRSPQIWQMERDIPTLSLLFSGSYECCSCYVDLIMMMFVWSEKGKAL